MRGLGTAAGATALTLVLPLVGAAPTTAPTSSPTTSPTVSPSEGPSPGPTSGPTTAPTKTPTASPSAGPTVSPTATPTKSPTENPTSAPTTSPSSGPTNAPTKSPSASPTRSPTVPPTTSPTLTPTNGPSGSPTTAPTKVPSSGPTVSPTSSPTSGPTRSPTSTPTSSPTGGPTNTPTSGPTSSPTSGPTSSPTSSPTRDPSSSPTHSPTVSPTSTPSSSPTTSPTVAPTNQPSGSPTSNPTPAPTEAPTRSPSASPTEKPTPTPTMSPTNSPSSPPTVSPTVTPTGAPTTSPTYHPTKNPTSSPTPEPTRSPTASPTRHPTGSPTRTPTEPPTSGPTSGPSSSPTRSPTLSPTVPPTQKPSASPTARPTAGPSTNPTQGPSRSPSRGPTFAPTVPPTLPPTSNPTRSPTGNPTQAPTERPTQGPTRSPTQGPSRSPTRAPTGPTAGPTLRPTRRPTMPPTDAPTRPPTVSPTAGPSAAPTGVPSAGPSLGPTAPSAAPSTAPPTAQPSSSEPTRAPTAAPTPTPTAAPTQTPTAQPTAPPSPPPPPVLLTASPTPFPVVSPQLPTARPSALPSLPPGAAAPSSPPPGAGGQPTAGPAATDTPTREASCAGCAAEAECLSPACRGAECVAALSADGSPCAGGACRGGSCGLPAAEAGAALERMGAVDLGNNITSAPRSVAVSPGVGTVLLCVLQFPVPFSAIDRATAADRVRRAVAFALGFAEAAVTGVSLSAALARRRGGALSAGDLVVMLTVSGSGRAPPAPARLREQYIFKGYRLRSGSVTASIIAANDTFRMLDGAVWLCGQWGDASAAVWLNGTRDTVAGACRLRTVSPEELALTIRGGLGVVPPASERIALTLRPGVLRAGVQIRVLGAVQLTADQYGEDSIATEHIPPIVPGVGVLSLTTRHCSSEEDAYPEEGGDVLGPLYNPLQLSIGLRPWAEYNGALVGGTVLLSALLVFSITLYCLLAAVAPAGGPSAARLLELARFGWVSLPLVVFYPTWVMAAATVVSWGDDTGYRILAGCMLAVYIMVPVGFWHIIRQSSAWARCVHINPQESCCRPPAQGWIMTGFAEWECTGSSAHYRLSALLFRSFRERDKYSLPTDLAWCLAFAAVQTFRPQSSGGCDAQAYIVLALLLLRFAWLAARRVYIAPFSNAAAVLVAAAEVLIKGLLIGSERSAALTLSDAVLFVLIAAQCVHIGAFIAAEYRYWKGLVGCGTAGRWALKFRFALYFALLWGSLEVGTAADQAERAAMSASFSVRPPETPQQPARLEADTALQCESPVCPAAPGASAGPSPRTGTPAAAAHWQQEADPTPPTPVASEQAFRPPPSVASAVPYAVPSHGRGRLRSCTLRAPHSVGPATTSLPPLHATSPPQQSGRGRVFRRSLPPDVQSFAMMPSAFPSPPRRRNTLPGGTGRGRGVWVPPDEAYMSYRACGSPPAPPASEGHAPHLLQVPPPQGRGRGRGFAVPAEPIS
eukprot:TRINITY_DN11967_c0_g1_i2.p1 TRINITY_DN11967_c0_g1~~TRINITY_DN11967_c0_g1_i2.p1  ORF type:complete len:1501 (+),score=198.11 TRINITY_DN11967_c0_g1_i2:81-4505(+)